MPPVFLQSANKIGGCFTISYRLSLVLLKLDFLVKIIAPCYRCGGREIERSVRDAEDILGLYPGSALNSAGLLVSQIALVGGETAADKAVTRTSLCNTVIKDVEQKRKSLCRESNRGRMRNRTGYIAYAIMHHTVYNLAWVIVVSLMAGLDSAGIVV